jgi:RND family efflux transporter MFP subunit
MTIVPHLRPAFACLLLVTLLAGCGGKADKPGKAAAGSGAPVSVTTVEVRQRDLAVQLEATGTVVPVASVEVRSQLTSVVRKVHIKEGQFVRAGELMFTLDVRTDEANVAKLRAQMARDEAALADARRQLARSRDLLAKNFVSQAGVDSAQAQVDSQTALVAVDRAALEAARVSLDYGRITAPSAGRVGAVPIFPGSAVQANITTLVTITQLDPIDVSFSVPQRYLGDIINALKGAGAVVTATLPGATTTLTGRLQFVDSSVDAGSGAIRVKARFENRDQALWPGAFVKAALTVRTLRDALIVPEAAIVQNTRGTIVYTVENDKAVLRKVEVLASQAGEAAVTGVAAGDRVVLDGRQNLRPDAAVVERTGKPGASSDGGGMAPAGTKPRAKKAP